MHMRQKVHVGDSPQRRLILRITNNKRCIYFVQGEPEGLGHPVYVCLWLSTPQLVNGLVGARGGWGVGRREGDVKAASSP